MKTTIQQELEKHLRILGTGYSNDDYIIHIKNVTHAIQKAIEEAERRIDEKCHSLGEPDWNGENHIKNIHWKQLSEEIMGIIKDVFGVEEK